MISICSMSLWPMPVARHRSRCLTSARLKAHQGGPDHVGGQGIWPADEEIHGHHAFAGVIRRGVMAVIGGDQAVDQGEVRPQ